MSAQPTNPAVQAQTTVIRRIVPQMIYDLLGTFNGVQDGGVASYALPVGAPMKYYGIMLRFLKAAGAEMSQAEIATDVSKISILLNGQPQWELTPASIQYLNNFYGTNKGFTAGAGYVFLDLAQMLKLRDPADIVQLGWGTANVNQMTVQCTLAGTLAALVSIEMRPFYTQVRESLGLYKRYKEFPQNFASTGDHQITDLPNYPLTGLTDIHITPGSGAVNTVNFLVNNTNYFNTEPLSYLNAINQLNGNYPNSSYAGLDFDPCVELAEYIPMSPGGVLVNDIRLTTNFSTQPDAYKLIVGSLAGFQSM